MDETRAGYGMLTSDVLPARREGPVSYTAKWYAHGMGTVARTQGGAKEDGDAQGGWRRGAVCRIMYVVPKRHEPAAQRLQARREGKGARRPVLGRTTRC